MQGWTFSAQKPFQQHQSTCTGGQFNKKKKKDHINTANPSPEGSMINEIIILTSTSATWL